MKRWLAASLLGGLLSGLLSGCGTLSGFMGGEDNTEPPAELLEIDELVTLQELWSTSLGVGYDEQYVKLVPAVDAGKVYVADRKGRVAAFDAATGKELWSVKTGAAISAGPGVGGDMVLVGTSDAELLALQAADGSLFWKAQVGSEVLSVPQFGLGTVIVQTADGSVTALDAEEGTQLWVYDRSVPVLTLRGTSTPAVQHGVVIAGFANGKLVALSEEQGFVVWETSVAIPQGRSELERIVDIDGDPVIVGSAVYVTTFQGSVAVVDIQSGEPGWKRDMSSHAGLGVDFSQVYVTDDKSHVWALSRSTGAAEWKLEQLQHRKLTVPVPFDDYVAVGDFEGYLHLLSRYDGHVVARVRVDRKGIRARPLVQGDVLYAYGNGGKLAAYSLQR